MSSCSSHFATSHWEPLQCDGNLMCLNRSRHTAVTYNDSCIIFFGGAANGSAAIDVFDTTCQTWSQIRPQDPVPVCLYGHSAVMWGDAMVVFGGQTTDTDALDTLFGLNCATMRWDAVKTDPSGPRPAGRHGHAAVVGSGCMIVTGGMDEHEKRFDDLWLFHFDRCAWQCLGEGHEALRRAYHTMVLRGDELYLCGGTFSVEKHFVVMDMSTGVARQLEVHGDVVRGPSFRHASWLDPVDGGVWIHFGGTDDDRDDDGRPCDDLYATLCRGHGTSFIESQFVDDEQHLSMGFVPSARHGHSVTVVGPHVFVFGGAERNGTILNDMFRLVDNSEGGAAATSLSGSSWQGVSNLGRVDREGMLNSRTNGDTGNAPPKINCAKRT